MQERPDKTTTTLKEQRESSDHATPARSDVADPAACARASGTSAARPFYSILDARMDLDTEAGCRAMISCGEISVPLQLALKRHDITLGELLAGRDYAEQRLYLALRSGILSEPPLHELACRYAERAIADVRMPIDQRCVKGLAAKRGWVRGLLGETDLAAARSAAEYVARWGPHETSLVAEAAWVATWASGADAAWLAARATAHSMMWSMATQSVWMTIAHAAKAKATAWGYLIEVTCDYLVGVPNE